jgi:hypothetical protein
MSVHPRRVGVPWRLANAAACASSKRQAPTRADGKSVVQTAGDPRRPRPSQRAAAWSPPSSTTSLRSDPADADTHGHRTSDTGHLDARTPAPDTGHGWRGQARVDTGCSDRTLDAGRWPRKRTGDDGTAGIRAVLSHHAERSRAGMPVQACPMDGLCSAREPCRLGSKVTCWRETGSRTTRQRSVAPPAKARLGALLSSEKVAVASVGQQGNKGEELAGLALCFGVRIREVSRWRLCC